ncbi:DNA repair protein RecN [candidate division KSB1 bacterium]|nr:DNA repair protein RecN [candidate division KSB1 bacterium]
MIKTLYVKNFALIDELNVSFNKGFNIITGETGAGKSILIGALGALLGDKLHREVIRQGTEKGIVEGEFQLDSTPELSEFFENNDLDWFDGEVILRREISSNGRSRCFINDIPVTVTALSELGDVLVDMHGQHEHQLLLRVLKHMDYLDDYGHLNDKVGLVSQAFENWTDLQNQLNELLNQQEEIRRSREVLRFQYQEIMAVDPQPNEEEELLNEERILGNAELLYEQTSALFDDLYEQEGAVSEKLSIACKRIRDLAEIDSTFQDSLKECENALLIVNDVAKSMQGYTSNITFDAERLEQIRNRLAALTGLKKKYGGTIDAILEHKQRLQERLRFSENLDQEIKTLQGQVESSLKYLTSLCLELSGERQKVGEELAAKISQQLQLLGMPKSIFTVSNEYKDATGGYTIVIKDRKIAVHSKGIDHIEFLFSANPGSSPKPLVKTASGGEISRVMLAMKSLLAQVDRVPVLIFDEIDSGVSGRIAEVVGKNLKRLAASHQVISITHLPQIASQADVHYLVEKNIKDEHTFTNIRALSDEERVEQIARLFGGEHVTETHLKSAKEMLQQGMD